MIFLCFISGVADTYLELLINDNKEDFELLKMCPVVRNYLKKFFYSDHINRCIGIVKNINVNSLFFWISLKVLNEFIPFPTFSWTFWIPLNIFGFH